MREEEGASSRRADEQPLGVGHDLERDLVSGGRGHASYETRLASILRRLGELLRILTGRGR
jgi:hypothetical protein